MSIQFETDLVVYNNHNPIVLSLYYNMNPIRMYDHRNTNLLDILILLLLWYESYEYYRNNKRNNIIIIITLKNSLIFTFHQWGNIRQMSLIVIIMKDQIVAAVAHLLSHIFVIIAFFSNSLILVFYAHVLDALVQAVLVVLVYEHWLHVYKLPMQKSEKSEKNLKR